MSSKTLNIGNVSIQPGEKISLALPSPELYTCAPIHIPVHVLHGKRAGPVLVVCAAMNGYEMNGIAVIQKLLSLNAINSIKGTLIAIPVMNVYGLINQGMLLSSGKNLRDSFPGSEKGSFAERLAYLLVKEILQLATHCIGLSCGEPHTKSAPHLYTCLDHAEAKEMARTFQTPLTLNRDSRKGLLSLMYKENPIPTLVYESGEPYRIDIEGVKKGVRGIVRIMRKLEMVPSSHPTYEKPLQILSEPLAILSHSSGICRFYFRVGNKVQKGALLARITDPFSTKKIEDIISPIDGIILVESALPMVHEGDLIVQIAESKGNLDKESEPPA